MFRLGIRKRVFTEGDQALEQTTWENGYSSGAQEVCGQLLLDIWSDEFFFLWSCVELEVGLDGPYDSFPVWDSLSFHYRSKLSLLN